jgi:hypothetical protein
MENPRQDLVNANMPRFANVVEQEKRKKEKNQAVGLHAVVCRYK